MVENTIVYINGDYVRKSDAVISVYDSGFQHGDGVYEGIRAYGDGIFAMDRHLNRLYESCKSLDICLDISKEEMGRIIKEVVRRNLAIGCKNIHMRVQVTRGIKRQTGMHPTLNITPYSIVICADDKAPIFKAQGVKLVTTFYRRYSPAYLDPKIHSCNQLNQILAAIEALRQGADEAIMLDDRGFVAETNSTNIQFIKGTVLYMPKTDYQLPGITRDVIKSIAPQAGLQVVEKECSIAEFYNADEVFLTGTVGEVAPVEEIDGKRIGSGDGQYLFTKKLHELYLQVVEQEKETVY